VGNGDTFELCPYSVWEGQHTFKVTDTANNVTGYLTLEYFYCDCFTEVFVTGKTDLCRFDPCETYVADNSCSHIIPSYYTWELDGGQVGTGDTYEFCPNEVENGEYTLTVTAEAGMSDTKDITIIVGGETCECEGNFDCDSDQDGTDAAKFKIDFGRSQFNNPCGGSDPCNGDFDCDYDCDGTDAAKFKADFGRSSFNNPCPACVVGMWCSY
jgi:hypothetical protein